MSAEKKHIDEYFNNQLYNLETEPPEGLWDKIEERLVERKRKRMLNVYRALAASALFLLAVGLGYYAGTIKERKQNSVVVNTSTDQNRDTQERHSSKGTYFKSSEKKNKTFAGRKKEVQETISEGSIMTSEIAKSQESYKAKQEANVLKTETSMKRLPPVNFDLLQSKANAELIYPSDYINRSLGIGKEADQEPAIPRSNVTWTLGGNVAPLYSGRDIVSNKTNESVSFYNSNEKPLLAYAGGLYVYCEKSRWSIESGIYISQTGLKVKDIFVNPQAEYADGKNGILTQTTGSFRNSIGVINTNVNGAPSTNTLMNTGKYIDYVKINENYVLNGSSNAYPFDMEQRFQYIEIPIIGRYKLIDKEKMNVSLAGGLSTAFMVSNKITTDLRNGNITIIPTKEVNKTNYSGIIGLALGLPLSEKLGFKVEPRFNYSFNSINKSTTLNVHPYSFGVFSGVNYKF
jgi:hypothetical protein